MTVRDAKSDNKSLTVERGVWSDDERARETRRLNGFFANSMNSPSMSMVNFSSCVRFAPDVTREVAALPTRSAVQMETGVHAGV